MKKEKTLSFVCSAVLAVALLAAPVAIAKPNVVFILTDDLGYGDVDLHALPVQGTAEDGACLRLCVRKVDPIECLRREVR